MNSDKATQLATGHELSIVAKRLGHMMSTAMSTYIQEKIFTSEQNKLIMTIIGNDIYSD
jgi:hypothetical protein